MPMRASARGMPTAQPTMTGRFDFFEDWGSSVEGSEVGVSTLVIMTVETPAVPLVT